MANQPWRYLASSHGADGENFSPRQQHQRFIFRGEEGKQSSIYHYHHPAFIDPASVHLKRVGETEIATIPLLPGHPAYAGNESNKDAIEKAMESERNGRFVLGVKSASSRRRCVV